MTSFVFAGGSGSENLVDRLENIVFLLLGGFSQPDGGCVQYPVGQRAGQLFQYLPRFLSGPQLPERLFRQVLNDLPIYLDFSPDGELLAGAGGYRNVILLDGRTLEPREILLGHIDSVYSATWTPDGDGLITTSEDGTLRIWDCDRPGEAVVHAMSTRVEERVETPLQNASTGGHASRTVVTADGTLSAHFEHTIAITEDGPEVLTVPAS